MHLLRVFAMTFNLLVILPLLVACGNGISSDTPVPQMEPEKLVADTPIPPTNTPIPPTDTPFPPTDTPVPPTDTPIPPTLTLAPGLSFPETVEDVRTIENTVLEMILEEGVGERFILDVWDPSITIVEGGVTVRGSSGTFIIGQEFPDDLTPEEAPPASVRFQRFSGDIPFGDKVIIGEGDTFELLTFVLVEDEGWVYLRGKGQVILSTGEVVELGYSNSDVVPRVTPEVSPLSVPDPTMVTVLADGSGDYATLELAVESVGAGSVISLGEGTFHLGESVTIDRPLTLEGTGRETTIVTGGGSGAVITYTGEGLLTIRDVAFRREGDIAASVMVVLGGEVDFSDCGFYDAATNQDETVLAVGLLFDNDAIGIVKNCDVQGNAQAGIRVRGQANISLEDNTSSFNQVGIAYTESASGIVKNNQFASNLDFGVFVSGFAQPELIGNEIHDNGSSGIFYSLAENGGTAQQNNLEGNNTWEAFDLGTDIRVDGPYGPDLVSNACSKEDAARSTDLGDQSGIVFISRSELPTGITVEGNSCSTAWCSGGSIWTMTCTDAR